MTWRSVARPVLACELDQLLNLLPITVAESVHTDQRRCACAPGDQHGFEQTRLSLAAAVQQQ